MFKNIHFNKIILVLFIVGILIICAIGAFFLASINEMNVQIQSGQAINLQEIQNKTVWVLAIAIVCLEFIQLIS